MIIEIDWFQYAYTEQLTYNNDPINDHVDIVTKATYPIALFLHENLNMSCSILQMSNYGWLHNGTFSGAIGLFQKRRIKALAYSTIMLPERLMVAEFTSDVYQFR